MALGPNFGPMGQKFGPWFPLWEPSWARGIHNMPIAELWMVRGAGFLEALSIDHVTLGIIANGFVNSSPRRNREPTKRNREGNRDGPGACTNFLDFGEFAWKLCF